MSTSPSASKWLYGIHDPGGEYVMLLSGLSGWIVLSFNIGADAAAQTGVDLLRYRLHHFDVICVLNSGPSSAGALAHSGGYDDFAARCGTFVNASKGCSIWVIGNEPNRARRQPVTRHDASSSPSHLWRRLRLSMQTTLSKRAGSDFSPSADEIGHETISPSSYTECYQKCRDAIRSQPGHENDQVIVAAVAPWCADTRYAGNEWGDWIGYFHDVLTLIEPDACDGFALHTNTHQPDKRLISSDASVNGHGAQRHMEFRVYRDFLNAVPDDMRNLPVYITQAHQGGPWDDSDSGWIHAAYDEIDQWNQQPGTQSIHAMALYRWDNRSRYSLQRKTSLRRDLQSALDAQFFWSDKTPPNWTRGVRLMTLTSVVLLETPGVEDGSLAEASDRIDAYDFLIIERNAPVYANGQFWWYVREGDQAVSSLEGWIALASPEGIRQVCPLPDARVDSERDRDQRSGFSAGDRVVTRIATRLRRSAGHSDKDESDVVVDVPVGTEMTVIAGPSVADSIRWWLVRWRQSLLVRYTGWVAETTPTGQLVVVHADSESAGETRQNLFAPGDKAATLAWMRLRNSPGYLDKPQSDTVAELWQGTLVTILEGPSLSDDLVWWRVSALDSDDETVKGWLAEATIDGQPLLAKIVPEPIPSFEVGDLAVTKRLPVLIRSTPGNVDKPDDDIIGELRPDTTVVVQSEPIEKDAITWRRIGGITVHGEEIGYSAQSTNSGVQLIGLPTPLPGTTIPDRELGVYLTAPYRGIRPITQLWGENAWYYKRYSYDGVPLKGHNGIDYGIPIGNPILATDTGYVAASAFEEGGFGWYVKLFHSWGESIYAHMTETNVASGMEVRKGMTIGVSGNTGNSTGPHLHFAIRILPYSRGDGWGGYSDPLPYLDPATFLWPDYILDEELQVHRAGGRPIFPRLYPPGMAEDRAGVPRL